VQIIVEQSSPGFVRSWRDYFGALFVSFSPREGFSVTRSRLFCAGNIISVRAGNVSQSLKFALNLFHKLPTRLAIDFTHTLLYISFHSLLGPLFAPKLANVYCISNEFPVRRTLLAALLPNLASVLLKML